MQEEEMRLAPFSVHDWVHVSDVVKSIINTMQNAKSLKGGIINIATGVGHTNQEVVELIEKIVGKKAKITEMLDARTYDTNDWVAEPFTYMALPLKKGLEKYFYWYTGRG
jgi:nucleoside-diphosphate-sugar epimerase